jgi:YVTN family beta-propeller protein
MAINKSTNTIYVSNLGDNTLSMINGATCNATSNSSCLQPQPTMIVGTSPIAVMVDEATNTIYVANQSDGTVSVINGTRCQGSDTSRCNPGPGWPALAVGNRPDGLGLNPVNRTLYVANRADNTVSVIDTSHCNSSNTSDCTVKAGMSKSEALKQKLQEGQPH